MYQDKEGTLVRGSLFSLFWGSVQTGFPTPFFDPIRVPKTGGKLPGSQPLPGCQQRARRSGPSPALPTGCRVRGSPPDGRGGLRAAELQAEVCGCNLAKGAGLAQFGPAQRPGTNCPPLRGR